MPNWIRILAILSPFLLASCEGFNLFDPKTQSDPSQAALTDASKIGGLKPLTIRDSVRRIGNGLEIFRYNVEEGQSQSGSEWKVRGDGEIRFARVEHVSGFSQIRPSWSNISRQHYGRTPDDAFAAVKQELMQLYPHILVEEAQRNPSPGSQIDWVLEIDMRVRPADR